MTWQQLKEKIEGSSKGIAFFFPITIHGPFYFQLVRHYLPFLELRRQEFHFASCLFFSSFSILLPTIRNEKLI